MMKISASMKERLRAYYASTVVPIDEEAKARVVSLVAHETASCQPDVTRQGIPFWRFLVGQLRFVNPLAWVVQLALLMAMLLIVSIHSGSESSLLVIMIAAALSVGIAVPSVFKSFESDMAELEAACQYDSAQVLVCRLILFGLADVLWMTLAAWLVPTLAGGDPFRVFLYASTPFFAFCAICLHLSRVLHGRCVKACMVAMLCVILALWVSNVTFPLWFADASVLVWSMALIVAVALAIYEARRLIAQVSSGFVARTPSSARV